MPVKFPMTHIEYSCQFTNCSFSTGNKQNTVSNDIKSVNALTHVFTESCQGQSF